MNRFSNNLFQQRSSRPYFYYNVTRSVMSSTSYFRSLFCFLPWKRSDHFCLKTPPKKKRRPKTCTEAISPNKSIGLLLFVSLLVSVCVCVCQCFHFASVYFCRRRSVGLVQIFELQGCPTTISQPASRTSGAFLSSTGVFDWMVGRLSTRRLWCGTTLGDLSVVWDENGLSMKTGDMLRVFALQSNESFDTWDICSIDFLQSHFHMLTFPCFFILFWW